MRAQIRIDTFLQLKILVALMQAVIVASLATAKGFTSTTFQISKYRTMKLVEEQAVQMLRWFKIG